MLDILVALLSLIFLFFLPGFLLVLIIWPNRDALSMQYDLLFKCIVGIVFSIIISIFVGMVLYGIGSLSAPPELQLMRLWLILGILSIIFGLVSWRMGGLRELVTRRRTAESNPSIDEELDRLAMEKRKLQEKIALMESEEYKSDQTLMEEAAVRIPVLKKEIADINKRIDELIEKEEKGTEGEMIVQG
jgi:cell division protein FtsB